MNELRRDLPLNGAAAIVAAAAWSFAAWVWRSGPTGPIPMHFGLHGQIDRWGDRNEAALMIAVLAALLTVAYLWLIAMGRSPRGDQAAPRGHWTARLVVVLAAAVLLPFMAAQVLWGADPRIDPEVRVRVLAGVIALVLAATGALIGKAAPNPFVGVRTYWTLRSRLAWEKSNRLAGRLFFWLGVLALVALPFAPPARLLPWLTGGAIASAAAAVFESWRVWRADPERMHP